MVAKTGSQDSRPSGRRCRNPRGRPRSNVSWVRTPISKPRGRRLKVLTYARYSTDEQNPRSVPAQFKLCKQFLEDLEVSDFDLEELSDKEISGEQIWRPGINRVREGIAVRRWDLIICEDSSRLFRDPSPCDELVGSAVDKKMRMICINDYVDSAEVDEWEDRLYEAQRRHSGANRHTIKLIKRAQGDRWTSKATMGALRSGYKRVASVPATQRRPEKGPYFDEVDPQWAPVVHKAFQKIACGQPTWLVGKWLDEAGLPKTNGVTDGNWTNRRVIALIHSKIYRGIEKFAKTVCTKQHGTGKRKPENNDPEDVWEREMPHLRIVSDWLWYAANDAIDQRHTNRNKNIPRGADHPLFGCPRASRGPLSGRFWCGICGAKMHQAVRIDGGYRCSKVSKGLCWNKATTLRTVAHEAIRVAVVNHLTALDDEFEQIIEQVRSVIEDNGSRQRRIDGLIAKESDLKDAYEGLLDGLEHIRQTGESPKRLADRLVAREDDLSRVQAKLQKLREEQACARVPAPEELATRRNDLVARLQVLDRAAGAALAQLVPRIEAVPYQHFDNNLVVLRARFDLHLVGLLPESTRLAVSDVFGGTFDDRFMKIPILVDLFAPSLASAFACQALELREQKNYTFVRIGQELGLEKRTAFRAVRLGKSLRRAGRRDEYVELTKPPEAASRWRTHPRFAEADGTHGRLATYCQPGTMTDGVIR